MLGLGPRTRSNTRQSKLQPPVAGKDGEPLAVGRRIRTHPKGLTGFIRWIGPTHFYQGIWIGIELDTPDGRNDGEVQGSRYFTCTPGHGVFVRPDHCIALKSGNGGGSGGASNGVPSTPTSRERRPRMNSGNFGPEKSGLVRRTSMGSDNGDGPCGSGMGNGVAVEGSSNTRKSSRIPKGASSSVSEIDDHVLERLLASEVFSRALEPVVAERVRSEVAIREAQLREEQQALTARVDHTERLVEDAGGAMDDIARMVHSIHVKVAAGKDVDGRDSSAAGGDSGGGGNAGGDAGAGGRDDARVVELTKLLINVHVMSTQAAELLQAERKEKNARIEYLTNRVRVLEAAATTGGGSLKTQEPMEG